MSASSPHPPHVQLVCVPVSHRWVRQRDQTHRCRPRPPSRQPGQEEHAVFCESFFFMKTAPFWAFLVHLYVTQSIALQLLFHNVLFKMLTTIKAEQEALDCDENTAQQREFNSNTRYGITDKTIKPINKHVTQDLLTWTFPFAGWCNRMWRGCQSYDNSSWEGPECTTS